MSLIAVLPGADGDLAQLRGAGRERERERALPELCVERGSR